MNAWPAPVTPETPHAKIATPTGDRRFGAGALGLIAAMSGALSALVFGFAAMAVTASVTARDCGIDGGWCDLGAILLGVLVGLAIGGLAYVVTGIAIIRRYRPAGERANHIALHSMLPIVASVALGAVSSLGI